MKKAVFVFIAIILVLSSFAFAFDLREKPEKITFIHYKDGKIKPVEKGKPAQTICYKLLGVTWKTLPVSYVINPTNPDGLSESFVTSAISSSAEEWDKHTSKELFSTYSIDYSANWDNVAPDYQNEYSFGLYPQENVIAVTIVWGYFSGPRPQRRIVEYDILFNTYFKWGDASIIPPDNSSNIDVMDLQNIATHETGHGVGLGDLYNTCVYETMYGYSFIGETSKRDLNSGDIAGLQKMYGV